MGKILLGSAIAATVVVILVFPVAICAQELPPPRVVTERNEVQVIEGRPGCWLVGLETSTSGLIQVQSLDEIRKQWTEKMTPQQTSQLPPGYVDGMAKQIQDGQKKSVEALEKGGRQSSLACPVTPGRVRTMETIAFGEARCTRTVQESKTAFRLRVVCPAQNGDPEAHYDTDFELVDPQTLKGTIRSIPDIKSKMVQIMEFKAKWLSEAAPHMPTGVTDLQGRKPIGPGGVAGIDPYRIVAIIDGKQIVAGFAWAWINRVPPYGRSGYAGRLPELLQQLYAQLAVAQEAANMHLDLEEPWRSKLKKLGHDAGHDFAAAGNYVGDPNIPPGLIALWDDARRHIYWDAYLSQAPTDAERQALLQKIKEKYKIKVVDPDFFNDQREN